MIKHASAAATMAIAVLALGATAGAHHSGAMFEREKTVTVEGTVKEFQYTNPHSWLLVDVKNKDGSVTTWGFEAEGPSTLHRAGIRPSDFTPGTKLKITGRPIAVISNVMIEYRPAPPKPPPTKAGRGRQGRQGG